MDVNRKNYQIIWHEKVRGHNVRIFPKLVTKPVNEFKIFALGREHSLSALGILVTFYFIQ